MGLDMYLYGTVIDTDSIVDYQPTKGEWFLLGYWRKANHIQKWFRDRYIKNGDPFAIYPVEKEDLEQLLKICILLQDTHDEELALAILPPDNFGCCFGLGYIDDWYWEDIDGTIEILNYALADHYRYYYHASW